MTNAKKQKIKNIFKRIVIVFSFLMFFSVNNVDAYYTQPYGGVVCYEVYCYLNVPNTSYYSNKPIYQKAYVFTPQYYIDYTAPYYEYPLTYGEYTSAFYGTMADIAYHQDLTMHEISHYQRMFWESM